MEPVTTPVLPQQTIQTPTERATEQPVSLLLHRTPYDNDVTLIYKWAELFQVPLPFYKYRREHHRKNNNRSGYRGIGQVTGYGRHGSNRGQELPFLFVFCWEHILLIFHKD